MWRRYLHFWRPNPARDVDDELRFHFETRIEDLASRGIPVEQAWAMAMEEFGDVDAVRADMTASDVRREKRKARAAWIDHLRQDARYALRGIRRSPGLAATVVLTIAVGIGAAGSMYGLMWRLLLQPAPYVREPDRVVQMFQTYRQDGEPDRHVSAWPYSFVGRLSGARSITSVGAYASTDLSFGSGTSARRVRAVMASGDYWRVLGVRPAIGRWYSEAESHPVSGSSVIVLSHAFWRDYFGEQDVIGRVVKIAGRSYEVIGVAPRGFRGVNLEQVEVWLPFVAKTVPGARNPWHLSPFANDLSLIARLAPGVSPAHAGRELTSILRPFLTDENRRLGFNYHRTDLDGTVASLASALGRGAEGKPEAKIVGWLVAVGVILLAVAAINVAGVLLLRSMQRKREIALRSALGMSRGRLTALLLTEVGVLVLLGGMIGALLLVVARRSLERVIFPHLAWEPTAVLDPSTIGLMAGGVLLTFLLSGLVSLRHARRDVAVALREGGQQGSTRRSRVQRAILVAQTTLSVLLLIGATFFLRSLRNLLAEDLGVDTQRVYSVHVDFSGTGRKTADISAFYERARERIGAVPGVEQTSLARSAPLLRSALAGGSIRLPGHDTLIKMPGQGSPTVNYVTPEFFATTGMQVIRGRTFDEGERDNGPVVIVNRTMADLYWPGKDPVGQCVYVQRQTTCTTVVGIVEPQRMFNIVEEPALFYYRPLPRTDPVIETVLLRTRLSRGRTALVVRQALTEIDPDLPYVDVSELAAANGLEAELRPWRLGVTIFTSFGALAMLLASIGLVSAISYSVTARAREIGVRMAVGASRWDVLGLVLRDGMAIGASGVIGGVVLALAAAPWLGGLLYKVSPRDVTTFIIVSAVVLLIVLVAMVAPARRAAAIEPMRVLSTE
jgi:predicted permease